MRGRPEDRIIATTMAARRTLPRRRPEEGAAPVGADAAAAPPLPGPSRAMTPSQLLALQRSGAGNAVLARAFGDHTDTEEEEEQEGGGGFPLLLTDRPWSEIEPGPGGIPAPFPPAIDLGELPLVIHLPPELLAMLFPQQAPAPPPPEPLLLLEYHPMEPEAPEEAEATPETETEADAEAESEAEAEQPEAAKEPQRKRKKRKKGKGGGAPAATPAEPKAVAAPPAPVKPPAEMSLEEALAFIGVDKPAPAAKPKQPRAPRPNKAQEEARKKKQEAEKKAEEDERKRKQDEAVKQQAQESALCKDLRLGLGALRLDLEAARDAKPNDLAHRAIRRKADDEAKSLAGWLTEGRGDRRLRGAAGPRRDGEQAPARGQEVRAARIGG